MKTIKYTTADGSQITVGGVTTAKETKKVKEEARKRGALHIEVYLSGSVNPMIIPT